MSHLHRMFAFVPASAASASTDQAHLHKALTLCAALSERRGLFLLAERGPAREALIEAAEQAPPEDDARPALHAARRRAAQ